MAVETQTLAAVVYIVVMAGDTVHGLMGFVGEGDRQHGCSHPELVLELTQRPEAAGCSNNTGDDPRRWLQGFFATA